MYVACIAALGVGERGAALGVGERGAPAVTYFSCVGGCNIELSMHRDSECLDSN